MEKFSKLTVQFIIFLLPLFFLPITNDFFDFNKNYLLFFAAGAAIALFAVRSVKERRLSITVSSFDTPALLLLASFIVSLYFTAPNKVQAILQPAGAGAIIALIILYFFLRQLIGVKLHDLLILPITASASILSTISLINVTGIFSKLPVPALFKSGTFTPAGTLIALASFLIIAIVFLYKDVIIPKKIAKPIYIAVLAMLIAGLISSIVAMMKPANRPLFLPFSYGWSISLDTLKNGKSALFGAGPGNFLNAFTITKPASINQSQFWLYRFDHSSNFLLTLFTENGILGLAAFLLLIYQLTRSSKKSAAALAAAIMLLLMPANLLVLTFFFVMLSAMSSHKTTKMTFPQIGRRESDLREVYDETLQPVSAMIYVVNAALIVCVGIAGYFLIQWYRADVAMARGIRLAATPNNQETYQSQALSLQLNPYNPTYRIIFSRTTLALANLVSQKENLTENDKKTISDLVTQSVTSAKQAIQLSPSVITWGNLAEIYSNLIASTDTAVQWTATAYNQAVLFDPNNPILRVNVGGFYYSLKQYETASRQFEIAVSLKNDYANAWYNYANAQRELGKIEEARSAYGRTLALVTEGAQDFDRVKSEMDALPKSVTNANALQEPTDLTSPQTTPSANIKTPVKLGEESAPEIKSETPPQQSPTPSPSSSITPAPAL